MLVPVNRAGDEEVSTVVGIRQQGTPGILSKGLCRGKYGELWRSQLVDLILGNDIRRKAIIVSEGAHRVTLRLQLEIGCHGKLRCLRCNHRYCRLLRIM